MTTTHTNDLDAMIGLAEAMSVANESYGPICYRTMLRWTLEGVYGGKVLLKSVVLVRRRMTTRRWLNEFFDACRKAKAAEHVEPMPSERERKSRYKAARKRAMELGGI